MALHRQTTLSKQTSQVFQMTLDELQSSVAGSGKLSSMNLEEFLSTVWDQQGGTVSVLAADSAFDHQELPCHTSVPPNPDYSGKTVEEVWQAIQAGKGSSDAFESVTLGSFLQSVGLDMPASVSSDPQLANLHLPVGQPVKVESMIPGTAQQPVPHSTESVPSHELRLGDLGRAHPPMGHGGLDGEVHAVATIRMTSNCGKMKDGRPRRKAISPPASPSDMPMIEAPQPGAQARTARQRKRKEPDVVDERTARLQKRMVKNRESAARSRARKQEYTAQLEVQVARLRQENRMLLEKVVQQCPLPPTKQATPGTEPLRRTRTMPTPDRQELASAS